MRRRHPSAILFLAAAMIVAATGDAAARWRDALGLNGMNLTGGILDIGSRGPSTDPTDPEFADTSLDSVRGRTLFPTARVSFNP